MMVIVMVMVRRNTSVLFVISNFCSKVNIGLIAISIVLCHTPVTLIKSTYLLTFIKITIIIIFIEKMTGETPEVRSDKRKQQWQK